jgi:NADPH:quinone reductase-like Zn-dependent oxidoreductase
MFGWQVEQFGGIDAMRWLPLAPLVAGPGQLLVAVRASAINFAETRMRAGTYGGQTAPFVMGMECAGEVLGLGAGVTGFSLGQRVFGRARGSHATHVLLDAEHALPMPESLTFEQAAAIPVGWLTAWHALHTVAGADAGCGKRVLIEAVASSVGSAALQIARWQGCWVAGTASRDDKCQRALVAGAHAAYNYKRENLAACLRRDTGGHGADVGLMTIGEETATSLFDSMASEGHIVMYGSTGGRQVCFSLNIGTRNLRLSAMSISSSTHFLPRTMPSFRELALPRFANGEFRAAVDVVLPMSELPQAHRRVDERSHFGKIVLVNRD